MLVLHLSEGCSVPCNLDHNLGTGRLIQSLVHDEPRSEEDGFSKQKPVENEPIIELGSRHLRWKRKCSGKSWLGRPGWAHNARTRKTTVRREEIAFLVLELSHPSQCRLFGSLLRLQCRLFGSQCRLFGSQCSLLRLFGSQ